MVFHSFSSIIFKFNWRTPKKTPSKVAYGSADNQIIGTNQLESCIKKGQYFNPADLKKSTNWPTKRCDHDHYKLHYSYFLCQIFTKLFTITHQNSLLIAMKNESTIRDQNLCKRLHRSLNTSTIHPYIPPHPLTYHRKTFGNSNKQAIKYRAKALTTNPNLSEQHCFLATDLLTILLQ